MSFARRFLRTRLKPLVVKPPLPYSLRPPKPPKTPKTPKPAKGNAAAATDDDIIPYDQIVFMGEKTSRPAQSEKNRKEEKAAAERGQVREDDVLVHAVRPEKKDKNKKGMGAGGKGATGEEDMMAKFNPRAEPTEMELEAMKDAGLRPRPEVRDMLGEVITEGLEGNLNQELAGDAFTGELKGKKGLLKGMTENIYRWDTEPPTGGQLKRADKFFRDHPVKHLWTEARFREIEMGESPEVSWSLCFA
jgi:hypothetical protein